MIVGRAGESEERPTELYCPPAESRAATVEVPRSPQPPRYPFKCIFRRSSCAKGLFVCASPGCCLCARSRHAPHRCLSVPSLSAELFCCGMWLWTMGGAAKVFSGVARLGSAGGTVDRLGGSARHGARSATWHVGGSARRLREARRLRCLRGRRPGSRRRAAAWWRRTAR